MTMKDGVAVVDASGAKREISTELLENVEPGDYVMVHAGIAIAKIQEEEDEEADALLEDLSMREEKDAVKDSQTDH